jgi:hypothetical protein
VVTLSGASDTSPRRRSASRQHTWNPLDPDCVGFSACPIGLARFGTCLPNLDQLDRQVDILLAVLADIGWPGTGSASLGKLMRGWIMFVEPEGFIQDGQASQERS